MIDLHLHTTASDGRSTPADLVREAQAAGITTMAVTDHDTTAAWEAVSAEAAARGIACVPGIEITAVEDGRDVHVLGYFFGARRAPDLEAFLDDQRADRRRRLVEIIRRLSAIGVAIDVAALEARQPPGRALGRPLVAAALVEAGYVASIAEAFDRYLSPGRPGFVPRRGASGADVIERIARAGGVASLAHPGKLGDEAVVQRLVAAGLPAIEVHHPDHTPADTARYRALATRADLGVTGGSDYHGPGSGREDGLGRTRLPEADFERLRALAAAPRPT
ncbi:MAG: PHP domain-containing protein [Vicinamibacterales bacterium]